MNLKESHEVEITDDKHCSGVLRELYKQRKYSDARIKCNNKQFSVHKNILASCSAYFDEMFSKTIDSDILEVHNIDEETMGNLITYMYTGSVIFSDVNIGPLLAAAQRFNLNRHQVYFDDGNFSTVFCNLIVAGILIHGKRFLCESTNAALCLEVWKYAKAKDLTATVELAAEALLNRLGLQDHKKELATVTLNDFSDVLDSRTVKGPVDEAAYLAIMCWVRHGLPARNKHFSSLFSKLDMSVLSRDFLKDVVLNEELVRNCIECINLVVDELAKNMSTPSRLVQPALDTECRNSFFAVTNDCRVHSFDIEEQTWSVVFKAAANNRKDAAIAILDDTLYLVGGTGSDGNPINSVLKMDVNRPSLGWVAAKSMNLSRKNAGAICANGRLYVVGGLGADGNVLSTAEAYNPESDMWSTIGEMSEGRSHPSVVAAGASIYAMAGTKGGEKLQSVECYDTITESWKTVSPIPLAKLYGPSAVTVDSKIYLVATIGIHEELEALKYDPETNAWTQLATYHLPYLYTSACAVGSKVFLIDRWRKGDEIAVYNIACDQWATVVPSIKLGCRISALLSR